MKNTMKTANWNSGNTAKKANTTATAISRLLSIIMKATRPRRREWFKEGQSHREGDQPAIEKDYENGQPREKAWLKEGRPYR